MLPGVDAGGCGVEIRGGQCFQYSVFLLQICAVSVTKLLAMRRDWGAWILIDNHFSIGIAVERGGQLL